MTRATLQGTFVALGLAATLAGCGQGTDAQSGGSIVPFKVGTFDHSGEVFVGLVLRDTAVVDIARANVAFEANNAAAPKLTAPRDLRARNLGAHAG